MKVLLVNGGPHEKGCTNAALEEIAKTLAEEGIESEIIWLGNQPISGCIACHHCVRARKCVFDDAVNVFLDKAEKADGFVFGSPVHWAGATGALTSFMDRVFYADGCSVRNCFYMKPAAAICSARRAGTTATWDQINKYFGIKQMPIVPSQYWNMVHGFTPEDVQKDEEGLQTMRTLARNMAFMLRCKEVAMANGVQLPKRERGKYTNFIR